jgi:hypothetical protein
MQYNSFSKKLGSKTAYLIDSPGEPIFTPSIYISAPQYVHSKSPSFTIINGKGNHITGLFGTGIANIFLGDYKKKGLLLMFRGAQVELFLSDISPVELKAKLLSGQLNESLQRARQNTLTRDSHAA